VSIDNPMTKAERDELARLVRRREKMAKADAERVAAEREADFEHQLAKTYDAYDEAWREAYKRASVAVEQLNEEIQQNFEDRGIPTEFAPSCHPAWFGRGENISASWRAELRKVAKTRITAAAKAAKVEIERQSVELQTQLVAGGLQSEEARAFLAAMPTADALMPSLSVADIEAAARGRQATT
jgi:hypothetical protein